MPSVVQELIAPGLALLKDQQAWAVPLVFVLAFARSLAAVALAVPGNAVLIGAGALVGTGHLDLIHILAAIVAGAGLGNWLSYWIGYTFKDRIRDFRYFAKRPHLLPRGEAFFHRYGPLSIVISRFVGPLRATVPTLAGVLGMPSPTFQIANWLSALLWAGMMLLAGYMAVQQAG
jgi:membrane protein DedA with SNARE-associated domain